MPPAAIIHADDFTPSGTHAVPADFDPGPVSTSNPHELVASGEKGTQDFLSGLATLADAGPGEAQEQAPIVEKPTSKITKSSEKATAKVEPSKPTSDIPTDLEDEPTAKPAKVALEPDPDVPPPDTATKGITGKHWKAFHAKHDQVRGELLQAQQERDALKAELAKPRVDPEVSKRLDEALKERDLYSSKLESVAVELHPKFEATFKPRIESAIQLARGQVAPEHVELVGKLLLQPPSNTRDAQLEEISSQLTGLAAGRFNAAVASMDGMHAEKASLVANGRNVLKQWQAEAEQQRSAQLKAQEAQRESAFRSSLDAWKGKVSHFTERPDDVEHNEAVKSLVGQAKRFYEGTDTSLEEISQACLWAALGPKLAAQNRALMAQVKAQAGTKQAVKQAVRGPSSSAESGSTRGGEQTDPNQSAAEALMAGAARMGLLR